MVTALTALTTSAERQEDGWAAARREVRTDRVLLVVVAALLGWLGLFAVALSLTTGGGPARTFVESVLSPVPLGGATVLTLVAARRAVGSSRPFWTALSTSMCLALAAQLVVSAGAVAGELPGWASSVAGASSVAFYLPAGIAALWIGGRPSRVNISRGVLDIVVVGAGFAYLQYQVAIAPLLARGSSTQATLDSLYPVADGVVIMIALSSGIGARQFVPLPRQLITGSMALFTAMDVIWSVQVDAHGSDGHWLLLGYQLQPLLACLAAVIALRHREHEGRVRTLPSGLPMLAIVFVSVEVVLLVVRNTTHGTASSLDLAAGVFVFAAVVLRGLVVNREVRRTAIGLEQARAEQERLAVTDGLTALYNRRFFEEFLRLEAERSLRHGSPLSLIVADLDRFKWVNDEYGHPAGDRVLVEAARRLRTAVRTSDVLARYGGEEFVVVLPDTDPDAALEIAERCRRVLHDSPVALDAARVGSDRSPRDRRAVPLTGSFGVATLWTLGDRGVDDLVRAADRALYRAKSTGRNRVSPAGEWDFLSPADSSDRPAETDLVAVALLRAAELVDADQAAEEHGRAIARWSAVLADDLGLGERVRQRCVLAARLHDVGKLAIPQSVLTKPHPLNEQEWALMRTHPEHSEALVALSVTVAELGPLVRAHHERFDGTGYPDGLAGDAIPIESRVITVCDAWAAMRVDRTYARARPVSECRREVADGRGGQFDPVVADAFLRLEEAGLVGGFAPVLADATTS